MKHRSIVVAFVLVGILAFVAPSVHAQGGAASSLSGTVIDASGAVIPGADIKAKHVATSTEFTAVSGEQGEFHIPALPTGAYSVTVSLMGFKTFLANDVILSAGIPRSLRVTLEVGTLEETVIVKGGSELVQTQSAAVATTVDVNQISNLPLVSRSAMDFVVFLPGVNTPAGSRDSTINGLPQSSINITLDGMNIQDNYLKGQFGGDGFFTRVTPRLDAVEEVTVTTAAQGADTAGQGAVNIRFVTRSGSNRFSGSSYHYFRHHTLNANTWFNNRDLPVDPATGKAEKSKLVQHQPGTRVGGPLFLPGLYDGRDRAFFFVNYEVFRQPSNPTRNRTVLRPHVFDGIFRYETKSGIREVNLLELAARNARTSTTDPLVMKLLRDIQAATQTTGRLEDLTDPNLQRYSYQFDYKSQNEYPTIRLDFNLARNHRITGSYNYQHINSSPDTTNDREPTFPGFPNWGSQQSTRWTTAEALRSTFGAKVVNEIRAGATGGATLFSPEVNPAMFSASVANQGGYTLGITAAGITGATAHNSPSSREASTMVVEDTLSWVKGSHSLSFGGSLTQATVWLRNQQMVPTISFDVITGDPSRSMFSGSNFPDATSSQISAARGIYATLVGSVSAIGGEARINEQTERYEYLGQSMQRGRLREWGFFVQDSWRWKPNFTVNIGLRYELQGPFYALNNSYSTATMADVCGVSGVNPKTQCNLFQPGLMPGQKPVFVQYGKGVTAYNTDKNNFAPSLGIAWTLNKTSGILGRIIGDDGDTVLRAGYALGYERPGMSDFTRSFGANPGISYTTTRNQSLGNLIDSPGFPLLLRHGASRLGPAAFPETQVYPLTEVQTGDVSIFDPNLQVPYAQTWTAGWQRKITREVAVEVRYVGSRHLQGWSDFNYNEVNIHENGFLEEFRLAQQNLYANIAAGRGDNFRYYGPGTSTSPLPIYLAYFTGKSGADVTNASAYSSGSGTALFSDDAWLAYLNRLNPNVFSAANALDGDAGRRQNALNAGLPANFLVANPDLLGGAYVTGNSGYTRYDGVQVEARRRLSGGLQVSANYSYGQAYVSNRYSFRVARKKSLDTGTIGGVTHAFKANWLYELPFGRGRRFFSNVGPVVERIIAGWHLDGTARLQSGRLLDFGNVRLVGMSEKEFVKSFKLRFAEDGFVYNLPADIIENTRRAFSTNAVTGYTLGPPEGRYLMPANGPDCMETIDNGYGDCGLRNLVVTGPRQVRFDMSAVKRVNITGRVTAEFRGEFLNVFNHPWFTPTASTSATLSNHRVSGLSGEPTSRIIQLVSRVSW